MEFLEEQIQAIYDTETNLICVSAGAGSGKTTVLTERYLNILQIEAAKDPDFLPENILTLTFSEEASLEMKDRIANKMIKDPSLSHFLPLLNNAQISTIHAFCLKILKENIFDLGISPDFKVQNSDLAKNDFLSECLSEVLEGFFREKKTDFLDFLDNFANANLQTEIIAIYEKMKSFDILELKETDFLSIYNDLKIKIECILQELNNVEKTDISENLAVKLEKILSISPNYLILLGNFDPKDYQRLFAMYDEIKENTKNIRNKSVSLAIKELKPLMDETISLAIEKKAYYLKSILKDILKEFSVKVLEKQNLLGILDFDSLQFLAKELLLKKPEILKNYQNKFKYILVDEYQDTSPLQDHLIKLIAKNCKLFVVGDKMQAIYGFRNASEQLLADLELSCLKDKQKEKRLIRLTTNYRSTKLVLDYINQLFVKILAKQNLETIIGANSYFDFLKLIPSNLENNNTAIDYLLVDGKNAEERRYLEAIKIAKYIKDSIKHNKVQSYSDIAILFRSITNIGNYESVFKKYNIPYLIVRSGNFYSRPEIIDVFRFLKIVFNPKDNFSFLTVLKSNFVKLNDDSLFWLLQNEKKLFYQGLLELNVNIDDKEKEKIIFFRDFYFRILEIFNTIKISELIQLAILKTNYQAVAFSQTDGIAQTENLEKLIQIAIEYENEYGNELGQFCNYLEKLISESQREEEMITSDADKDLVKIITVHKAKGLEFSLVILADLEKEFNRLSNKSSSFFNIDDFGNLGFKLENNQSYTYQKNKKLNELKEKKEELRCFYVACTRAKNSLVFSGINNNINLKKENGFKSYAQLIKCFDENIKDSLTIDEEIVILPSKKKDISLDINNNLLKQVNIVEGETLKPFLSITEIIDYLFCPKYYYLLKQKQIKKTASNNDALDLGNAVHSVLERIDFKNIDLLKIENYLAKTVKNHKIRLEANQLINKFLKSDNFLSLSRKALNFEKEKDFTLDFDSFYLKGKIDLFIETIDKEIILLDYKTNKIDNIDFTIKNNYYDFQLKTYSLAVYKILKLLAVENSLYFIKQDILKKYYFDQLILDTHNVYLKKIGLEILANQNFEIKQTKKCQFCKYLSFC